MARTWTSRASPWTDARSAATNTRWKAKTLTVFDVPAQCRVQVVTRIVPEQNTALEGLYKSGTMYCTQCEAEGFRKITYYPDRPDVSVALHHHHHRRCQALFRCCSPTATR